MTTLGIIDMLDPRAARASGSASTSRHATPGAAAFADVIHDASRVSADDTDGAASGTATDDSSADPSNAPYAPAPPVIIPPSGTALTAAVQSVVEPSGEGAGEALIPAPADAPAGGTGSTDAPSVTAATAELTAAAGANGSPSSTAGAVASAAAVEGARAQPVLPEAARIRTPVMTSAAAPLGTTPATGSPARGASPLPETAPLGTPETDAGATDSTAPRLGVGVGSATFSGAVASGRPDTPPGTPDAAATGPDASPDTATTPLPASAASASASPPAPTQTAQTGEALAPPPAVGSTAPPAAAAPAAAPVSVPLARPVLLPQIAAPVLSLAQAPDGDHSLTLTVSPESLGPVTVRAHISGGAIHIELHAPNDLGRDALRAILVDLRRDLAAAAPQASLMLSTSDDGPGASTPQNSPNGSGSQNGNPTNGTANGTNGGQPGGGAPAGRGATGPRPEPDGDPSIPDGTTPAPLVSPHGGIEVFA